MRRPSQAWPYVYLAKSVNGEPVEGVVLEANLTGTQLLFVYEHRHLGPQFVWLLADNVRGRGPEAQQYLEAELAALRLREPEEVA